MPTTIISGMTAGVGGGGNVDVVPPVGQAWHIKEVTSQHAFVTNAPDVEVRIRNGAVADAIVSIDPTTSPNRKLCSYDLYITNTNWMRLVNTGAAGGNIGHLGYRVNVNTAICANVACGIGATIFIQPPVGETWVITDIGSELWHAVNIYPDIDVGVTNGALLLSMILSAHNARGWLAKRYQWYINNMVYIRVTNTNAAANAVGYTGFRTGVTAISSIQTVGIGATLDVRPLANTEWVLTEFAAEIFAGAGPPADAPDIMVSLATGAGPTLSELLEPGSIAVSLRWNYPIEFPIDNTNWIRITNVNAATNQVGVLGYLKRTYSI